MKNRKKIFLILSALSVCIFAVIFLFSCKMIFPDVMKNGGEHISIDKPEHKYDDESKLEQPLWNILIYMSADNNLEGNAIDDICEMESSNLDVEKVCVFVLIDRHPGYDSSDGNWTGTRLYRLKTNSKISKKKIISEEIECRELGLKKGENTELDMSSQYVFSDSLSFITKHFPAKNYGLIIWGHGTGYKGFSYDETSRTYMTLSQLGDSLCSTLGDSKLDFIGFDTCFGAEIEVVYELKDYASYFIGTEGLQTTTGWNYKEIFNQFQQNENKTAFDFCKAVNDNFKKSYSTVPKASIACVDTAKFREYFSAFDDFCFESAKLITSRNVRDDIIDILLSKKEVKTERYSYESVGSDIYLDNYSLVKNLTDYFRKKLNAEDSAQIIKRAEKFFESDEAVVAESWASDRDRGGLGVYFSTYTSGLLLSVAHPGEYTKGKYANQIQFVKDSNGYVPDTKMGVSLLNKLFYSGYN